MTATDVADELWRVHRVRVDRRKLELHESIKRIGRYEVPVELFADVTATLRLAVVPEGGELPPQEELDAIAEAEAQAEEAAQAEAETAHAEAEAELEALAAVEEEAAEAAPAGEPPAEADETGPEAEDALDRAPDAPDSEREA